MTGMTEAMQGTLPVPADDPVDVAALERWMAKRMPGFEGPIALSKFKGGQSNPTYRVDTPAGAYVLRRQPFGKLLPSAHAVDREYRVIAALHPTGFPVPAPVGLCDDPGVIGAMFYVMALVEGRNLWEGALPGMEPPERRATYFAIVDTLARLHGIDPASIGLGDYGKPGNYFERQVARWTKQYRASETEPLPAMDKLIDWLAATVPEQQRVAVVHGDYRIDNMILAPDAPRVAAVLDWELSTLGDPMADFAYYLMAWVTPLIGPSTVYGVDHEATGIPTLEEAADRYAEKTGFNVPDLGWYKAYNLFRFTAILQGIKKRVIDGTASSAQAAQRAEMVPGLAEAGWDFARKAGAE